MVVWEEDEGGGGGQLGGGEGGSASILLPASQVLQDAINLLLFTQSLEERQQVQQLRVIQVVKPGLDRNLRHTAPR